MKLVRYTRSSCVVVTLEDGSLAMKVPTAFASSATWFLQTRPGHWDIANLNAALFLDSEVDAATRGERGDEAMAAVWKD